MFGRTKQTDISSTALPGGAITTVAKNENVATPDSHSDIEKDAQNGDVIPPQTDNDEPEYPPARKAIPVMGAIYLAFLLISLDRTILATAIPRITDDFHSLGDVGWYASAYLLTSCAFQLLFGRIYTFYSPKKVILAAVTIFEIGSAICGAAPNSKVFILGRAVAGLGAAGLFSGAVIVVMWIAPLHKRPLYQGPMGAIMGIASVGGPLLGGVFTSKVSWRWCFYINLPIGGVVLVILFLILDVGPPKNAGTPWRQQIKQLDPLGLVLFLPAVVSLLLALQWGGSTYAWSNGRIIALLVLAAVLAAAFISVQLWKPETGLTPIRIVRQRSIAAGMWLQFFAGAAMMSMVYFIPIWFQAIKGVSPVKSGIMLLGLLLALVVAAPASGILVSKVGYYTPMVIAQSCLMSIGAGLITTWTPATPHGQWIGYQVIFGFGLGLGVQVAVIAAQACLSRKDASTGISLVMFAQLLGGAIFTSVSENIFSNEFGRGLRNIGTDLDAAKIVRSGATEIRKLVSPEDLPAVLDVYNGALVGVFRVALVASCLTIIGALCMEWKSVRKGKGGVVVAASEKNDSHDDSDTKA